MKSIIRTFNAAERKLDEVIEELKIKVDNEEKCDDTAKDNIVTLESAQFMRKLGTVVKGLVDRYDINIVNIRPYGDIPRNFTVVIPSMFVNGYIASTGMSVYNLYCVIYCGYIRAFLEVLAYGYSDDGSCDTEISYMLANGKCSENVEKFFKKMTDYCNEFMYIYFPNGYADKPNEKACVELDASFREAIKSTAKEFGITDIEHEDVKQMSDDDKVIMGKFVSEYPNLVECIVMHDIAKEKENNE